MSRSWIIIAINKNVEMDMYMVEDKTMNFRSVAEFVKEKVY